MLEERVHELESVLSVYDPSSELYRVNKEAKSRYVKCSFELFEALKIGLEANKYTHGYFDIGWKNNYSFSEAGKLSQRLFLDATQRKLAFADNLLELDFGGMGKGYALELLSQELSRWNITGYLLDAGASSVLAKGWDENHKHWTIQFKEVGSHFELNNQAFSCSRVPGQDSLHEGIKNPFSDSFLSQDEACFVTGPKATYAEIYSTALLAMGREKAKIFCQTELDPSYSVSWFRQGKVESLTSNLSPHES